MRSLTAFILAAVCLLMTGCHCFQVSEHYNDHIDDFSDNHKLCFDRFYCEKLDLTRLCMNRRCPHCYR